MALRPQASGPKLPSVNTSAKRGQRLLARLKTLKARKPRGVKAPAAPATASTKFRSGPSRKMDDKTPSLETKPETGNEQEQFGIAKTKTSKEPSLPRVPGIQEKTEDQQELDKQDEDLT